MRQWGTELTNDCLPFNRPKDTYVPRAVRLFHPRRIVLAKGSLSHDAEERTRAICNVYSDAEIVDRSDRSHIDVELHEVDPLARHQAGKQTLVIGEHKSAIRFSREEANCCPNYWHFSPYGFCPYGCTYCYLAGTQGVWFSPTVKVFVNIAEMLDKIDQIASQAGKPTGFYLGKLQDGLALDPLTGYSRLLVPFFAQHRWARLVILTKSADMGNLVNLKPADNTIISWSLTSEDAWRQFEPCTPSPAERLAAMRRSAAMGYRVRAVIMPVLPVQGWAGGYAKLLADLLAAVPVERITLGSLCSFSNALRLTDAKLGNGNPIRQFLKDRGQSLDGRYRFNAHTRLECYQTLVDLIRLHRPDLPIALCLEEKSTFAELGLSKNIGVCNCVL